MTPRLSDRQSLKFGEHGNVNAVPFATMPNQIIVTQISNGSATLAIFFINLTVP